MISQWAPFKFILKKNKKRRKKNLMYNVKINGIITLENVGLEEAMIFVEEWLNENPDKDGFEISLEFLGDN
jgi:hypothetical protein